MKRTKVLLDNVAGFLGIVIGLSGIAGTVRADDQDKMLVQVHTALRITGPNIQWVRNQTGGASAVLVYDITNCGAACIPVPVTVIGNQPGRYAGSRQLWIERVGRDASIPALPKGTARRGRQYAFGGSVVVWNTPDIVPTQFQRYTEALGLGGFPSGQYVITIEYQSTHHGKVLQSESMVLNIP